MLLIHGAWQGAWAWEAWLPELQRLGWSASAIDLPGNGNDPADRTPPGDVSLALYVEHAGRALAALGGPAVVVGHSGGGIVASQLGEAFPERVAALVFVAGMMLPSGMSFRRLMAEAQAEDPATDYAGIGPHLQWSADRQTSVVPAEAARAIFLHDCDPAAAAAAAARLRPQPERGRAMAPTLSAARHGQLPRLYVEARQDRSISLALQQRMQRLSPGARRLSLDCGHVPQLALPRALAEGVCAELDALPCGPLPRLH